MNRLNTLSIFLLLYFFAGVNVVFSQDSDISKNQLDQFILNHMLETQKVFDWSTLNSTQLHAAQGKN